MLSVTPGKRSQRTTDICPWLDGEIADSRWMDKDGGAQVAPFELCTKLMESAVDNGAELMIGSCEGVEKDGGRISHVRVDGELVPCKAFVCTMGPWAALAQDWFDIPVPMTGIKSTSIVFKDAEREVEPFALFCGEDNRFGTHLEVYPRNSGEVYLCGIGGSEYVDAEELRAGKYPPGEVHADPKRVEAATKSFSTMSKRLGGTPETVQACMRPCPPDAMPYMGKVQGFENAYMSAGHNVRIHAKPSREPLTSGGSLMPLPPLNRVLTTSLTGRPSHGMRTRSAGVSCGRRSRARPCRSSSSMARAHASTSRRSIRHASSPRRPAGAGARCGTRTWASSGDQGSAFRDVASVAVLGALVALVAVCRGLLRRFYGLAR